MTDEKEKIIAAMVLAHDELLEHHAAILISHLRILNNLTEDSSSMLFPNSDRHLKPYIESLTERFEAVDRDKAELRKNLREAFELDGPSTLNPQPSTV